MITCQPVKVEPSCDCTTCGLRRLVERLEAANKKLLDENEMLRDARTI